VCSRSKAGSVPLGVEYVWIVQPPASAESASANVMLEVFAHMVSIASYRPAASCSYGSDAWGQAAFRS
jgi:hypothetical protein